MLKDSKKYIAELLGTAILVFIACGVAVYTGDLVATGLAFGLVVVAMAYAIGPISGCHINPAISFGMMVSGRMKAKECGLYMIAQVIGAVIGGALLFAVYHLLGGTGMAEGAMAETLYSGGNLAGLSTANAIILGLMIEIILTFIFVFVILGVTSKKENGMMAGLVIGLTLAFVIIAGANFTGPSVNPARSIGSALFAGTQALQELWMFIVAPLAGAALAALASRFLFTTETESKPTEAKKETK